MKNAGAGVICQLFRAENYLSYLISVRNLSPATVRAYRGDLAGFAAWMRDGDLSEESVDAVLVRRYIAHLSRQNAATSTTNRILSSLKGYYRFLVRIGERKSSPLNGIRGLRREQHLPTFLFEDEISDLLRIEGADFTSLRDRLIFEMLYSTGCRVGELVMINIDDIDYASGRVLVHGKGRKDRLVFLGGPARQALKNYLPSRGARLRRMGRREEKALIVNANSGRITQRGVAGIIQKRMVEKGTVKRVSPHTFRHTFATHILDRGADIRVVQELLGHSSLSTTQVYTHLGLGALKRIYDQAHPHAQIRRDSGGNRDE